MSAALGDVLEQLLNATNSGLRACEAEDPAALHRALDERVTLLDTCQKMSARGGPTAQLHSLGVAIRRLDAELGVAAARLRHSIAADLAAATRAKSAVGDYLANGHNGHRLDRAL